MPISDERFLEFMRLYEEEWREKLTAAEAREMATNLIFL